MNWNRIVRIVLLSVVCGVLLGFSVTTNAQEQACGVMVRTADEANRYNPQIQFFRRFRGEYHLESELNFPEQGNLWSVRIAPNRRLIYTYYNLGDQTQMDFFYITPSFELVRFHSLEHFEYETWQVSPSWGGGDWSGDSTAVSFTNVMDSYIGRFFLYSLVDEQYLMPADLTDVHATTWSRDGSFMAFVGFNLHNDGGTHIINDFDVYIYWVEIGRFYPVSVPVDRETLARIHWFTDDELAITHCTDDGCRLVILDIRAEQASDYRLGDNLVSAYLAGTYEFITTSLDYTQISRTVRAQGEVLPFAPVDRLWSEPMVSADERYVVYTADVDGIYRLIFSDIETQETIAQVELRDDRPDLVRSNWGYTLPHEPYFSFGDWHPTENRFLYVDSGAVHVLRVESGNQETVVEFDPSLEYASATWVCP